MRQSKFYLYILKMSIDRSVPLYDSRTGHAILVWDSIAHGLTRTEVIESKLPEIREKVLSQISDPSIKYVSVFCGKVSRSERHSRSEAERLQPIQICVETGLIRN